MFKTKISKACQECRKRKIRCDGQNPCSACQRRNTVCQFRERARVRKPTAESSSNHASDQEEKENEIADHHQPQSHLYRDVHRSVSARHRSSSDSVELYYGPTSDFSLLQHLYHSLYLNGASRHDRDDSEEVGQGLDFFRVRHIFFGPAATALGAGTPGAVNLPLPPAHIAHALMNRFLATHYNVVPFYSKSRYDQLLGALYNDTDNSQCSQVQKQICLLAIATAAANTEHFEWGATISQYCQAQHPKMQYTVSLECIQLGILMTMYHLECAHSNIAYMVIGDTCRKAFAAGLHRQQSRANPDDNQGALERHHTFWSLYFMEIWVSFFLGRPSMLEYFKAEVPEPQDIFLSTLVQYAKVMLKVVQQIYRSQCAPSVLWNSAMTVGREMNALQSKARSVFGIELDAPRISDPRGMRPTILITLYNFMSLLIFRPFVIIRGKLQHPQQEVSESVTSRTPPDIPSWLNDACHKCLHAARSIIVYTCHIAAADPLLLELRFNCFYLENSLFLLLYDMASNPENRDHNLPLIHSGLRFLTNMRPGDPVCSSIATIRRILQHMNLDVGPGEPIQHAPPSHSMGFDPLASNSPPAPASQMSMYPSPWEEQPPQQVEESGAAAGNDFQFDLDFSAADFNVDITAIDWGTFFSYVPS
ncbi:hypothetical protein BDV34DRAFT_61761 [Aspergillus parasiticus]|uniref:Zn(2)-C6 fungal-type domain-containing protein n=1 Tax=Aspergillus parasiticus TaxID=5067 RepID=A0A5N6E2S5_ASPPA|nr:hypothetical protein BDV34DRAFT_61761 [Aspergillus parasiticus]